MEATHTARQIAQSTVSPLGCSCSSLGINAAESNRPDRTGRWSERPRGFFTKTPTPPPPFCLRTRTHPGTPIQTVAAVAERVVSRDSPPPQRRPATTRSPSSLVSSRLLGPHLRPSPSPSPLLPHRGPGAELPREGRRPPGQRGGGYEAGGIPARDAAIPAVMCGSEHGCDPTGR